MQYISRHCSQTPQLYSLNNRGMLVQSTVLPYYYQQVEQQFIQFLNLFM